MEKTTEVFAQKKFFKDLKFVIDEIISNQPCSAWKLAIVERWLL